MRCKNCGSFNEDNLYICQNCGSPLYDDEEIAEEQSIDATKVMPPVNGGQGPAPKRVQNQPNYEKEEKDNKKSVAIIIVLVIVLVAIICGTIFAVAQSKKNSDETTTQITTATTKSHTTEPFEEETTTTTTTETTTTTTTTTTQKTFNVSLSCNEGGEAEGDGAYALGENITVIARADDFYKFNGWYKDGTKVSSKEMYSFTVVDNVNLQAVFEYDGTETEDIVDEYDLNPTEPAQ